MAELGNINLLGGKDDIPVEVDMLDYGYVNDCTDVNKLTSILKVLKSGKEGFYPDLMRVTEERMLSLMTPKDRRRYLSLNSTPTVSEIQEADAELRKWQKSVSEADTRLADERNENRQRELLARPKKLPPVRGSSGNAAKVAVAGGNIGGAAPFLVPSNSSSPEGNGGFWPTMFDARVLNGLHVVQTNTQRKKIAEWRQRLDVKEMTEAQRKRKANLERLKGNESFKVTDNEEAVQCYTRSIALDDSNPVVFANRAMAYIRMELFDLAEEDSSIAILLDPKYIKAFSRRGLVRFKRGKYIQAAEDFCFALTLDPDSAELKKLLDKCKEKYREVEGKELVLPGLDHSTAAAAGSSFTRVGIVVEDDDDDEDQGEEGGDDREFEKVAVRIPIATDDDDDDESDSVSENEREGKAAEAGGRANETKETPDADLSGGYTFISSEVLEDVAFKRVTQFKDMNLPFDMLEYCEDGSGAVVEVQAGTLKKYTPPPATAVASEVSDSMPKGFQRINISTENDSSSSDEEEEDGVDMEGETVRNDSNNEHNDAAQVNPASVSGTTATTAPPIPSSYPVEALVDSAESCKEQGNKLMAAGDTAGAIEAYSRSLGLDPCYVPSLNNRAQAYLTAKKYAEAASDANTVLQLEEKNLKALFRRASAFYCIAVSLLNQDGIIAESPKEREERVVMSYQQATADITAVLAADANNRLAKALQGKLAVLYSRLQEELNEYPTEQRRNKEKPSAQQEMGGEETKTIIDPEERVKNIALESDACKQKGNAAMQSRDYLQAVDWYRKAIELQASNLAAHNNRSQAYIKLLKFVDAEADATIVLDATVPYVSGSSAGTNTVDIDEGGRKEMLEMAKKAYYRRAVARHALAKAAAASAASLPGEGGGGKQGSSSAVLGDSTAHARTVSASDDLRALLKIDPNNKVAKAEYVKVLQTLKSMGQTSPAAGSSAAGKSSSSSSSSGVQTGSKKCTSTAPSPSASSTTAASFDASSIGMVARSSSVRKANTTTATTTHTPALQAADTSSASLPSEAEAGTRATTTTTGKASVPFRITPQGQQAQSPANTKKSSKSKSLSSASIALPEFSLPSEPPKTVYELERVWRGVKDRPEKFAEYLGTFKKSTFKKVIKEAVTPDLISSILLALRDHTPSAKSIVASLEGLSKASKFSMMMSMLPDEDVECLRQIFANLAAKLDANNSNNNSSSGDGSSGGNRALKERVEELKVVFGVV